MKTVFITGGNRGIGFETSRQMAQLGYFVYIGSRDKESGLKAKLELKKSGLDNVETVEIDVTDVESIKKAREILEAKATTLDVLINNAGIRGDIPQSASNISLGNLMNIFETNFFGVVRVTQQFIPLMSGSELPVIVNVSSTLASLSFRSDPTGKNYTLVRAGYGPSKTALNAYTVALAMELRETRFKVNCVNPGHTATAFNDYKGIKSVEEGASVIVKYALLDKDGPTGRFWSEEGETPW